MKLHLLKFVLLSLLMINSAGFAENGLQTIERSAKENKHLFIFFYKDASERTLGAQKIFDQTMQKLGSQANSAKVKITDPSEKGVVDKFDLKRTPMPFVIVLAPNGAVTGGFPSPITEQKLIDSFASPGMARCLKSLQDRKLVFLCLQNDKSNDKEAALKGVQDFKADPRYAEAAEIVVIDPADAQEKKFLNQLGVDTHSASSLTVFIAPPAETIGQYKGATSKDRFIADLQKAVSGCCAGGCCPGGCCPGGSCK